MANPTPKLRIPRSNLGRDFSFQYPYHRWIAVLSVLVGALAFGHALLGGGDILAALGRGFNAGAAAFVAWVLARELDPPRQWTGLLAGSLGGLAAIFWGPLPILAPGFLILPMRLVNQAAGFRPSPGDSRAVAAGGLLVMLFIGEWLLGFAAALALALDNWLNAERQTGQWALAAAMAASTLIYLFFTGWPPFSLPGTLELIFAGLAILFALSRLTRNSELGPNDRGRPLAFPRVAAALALALLVAPVGLFTGAGPIAYGVLWAALLGVGF